MEYLVSTNWLKQHQHCDDLVILDCMNFSKLDNSTGNYRTYSGHLEWRQEHIKGAGFADFSAEMSGQHETFRNVLPSPQELAVAIGSLGISNKHRVVLYDSSQSMWAARLWWMLCWIGFENVAVLDGGLQKWKADGGRTVNTYKKRQPESLVPHFQPGFFVSKEVVLEAIEDANVLIIDALSKEQYNGQTSILGLCGHIPGAINIPAESLIDPKTGLFFPFEKLPLHFQSNKSQRTIIYCGSGIAAASVAFTMVRLGFQDVAIYMPGLQEWVSKEYPLVN